MHRPSLNSLTAEEKSELARLIQEYVTRDIVAEHWDAVLSGVHQNPAGFLSFHRNYIAGLEEFLNSRGHQEWIPLPAWNPAEPIPPEFNIPREGSGRLRNLDPRISFSPRFDPENLAAFQSDAELGAALMEAHNEVHAKVGGVFNDLSRAPEAPIFWPFHSFIDDIWWEWQRISVIVPSCLGIPFAKARLLLALTGLPSSILPKRFQTGSSILPHFHLDSSTVVYQNPLPGMIVPRGTKVRLF